MALAGRAAEQIVFGRVTNGAANDLEKVTQVARAMVFEWGMGESVTSRTMRADNYALSEETKRLRDTEQALLTDAAYADALRLLAKHRASLDRIAMALLEKETLDRDELAELFVGIEVESRSSDSVGIRACPRRRPDRVRNSTGSLRRMEPDWPLETERLVLRPYTEDDLDNLHAVYVAAGGGALAVRRVRARSRRAARSSRARSSRCRALRGASVWPEPLRWRLRDGTYARRRRPLLTTGPEDIEHKAVEIGFSFDPRHQGQRLSARSRARADRRGRSRRASTAWSGGSTLRNAASAPRVRELGTRREAHLAENE